MLDDFTPPEISPELRKRIESNSARRPRTVLDHILKHGYVTTEELSRLYNYEHPPRAARDVREQGITLITKRVKGPNGRMIGAYLPGPETFFSTRKEGRRALPKNLKITLLTRDGERCALCAGQYPINTLQTDHRVPYEVAGDPKGKLNPEEFMLLCSSCNRSKSWICEHCDNWKGDHIISICNTCMLCSPHNYKHVAMKQIRSLTLTWNEEETQDYDRLQRDSIEMGKSINDYIKHILKQH